MSNTYAVILALIGVVLLLAVGSPGAGRAQGLDPRAAQAMALCNSPAGSLITECQQLKAVSALGGVPGVKGVTGIGQANPAAAAAAQQIYAACVRNAGINQTALASCNANLNNAMGLPQPNAAGFGGSTNTAMNIATGAGRYQACVSQLMAQGGQAGGINPCTPLLNGNPAGPGAPPGFGAPQAAGDGSLQAQRLSAYQACNAQLALQMRGHECAALLSGGPPPAGFNAPGMASKANPPAPGYNPPAPGFNPPAPARSIDPLAPPPNRPLDPLGL